MAPKKTEEPNSLEEAFDELKKEYGEDFIGGGEIKWMEIDSPGWTHVLGKGLPIGRIIEVSGEPSSGKTSAALFFAAQAQKRKKQVVWVDAEHAWDEDYAFKMGVKIENPITPMNGESALAAVEKVVAAGADLVVVDSVSALVPQKEIDAEIGDDLMAVHARMMARGLRRLVPLCAKHGTTVVFINQTRSTMTSYGPKTETTGGKALRFACSIRIQAKRVEFLRPKEGADPEGILIKIESIKNKVAKPFRSAELEFMYDSGFNLEAELLDVAERNGLVAKKGNTYYFGDKSIAVGRDKAKKALADDAELAGQIREACAKL